MNGDRIEHSLRGRGPREHGADLAPLPASITEARAQLGIIGRHRRLPLVARAVATVGAAAAGVILAALAGTWLLGGFQPGGTGGSVSVSSPTATTPSLQVTPTPQATMAPTPQATAQPSPAVTACLASSLHASAQPWGGAAGSRGTTLTVTNSGTVTCTLHGRPGASIADASGAVLVSTAEAATPSDPVMRLAPGQSAITSVVWSNWCGTTPSAPMQVTLVIGGQTLAVEADASAPAVLVPPCLGSAASSLSTIAFQAGP
jgi:Domain of unknown function (DUF4232)